MNATPPATGSAPRDRSPGAAWLVSLGIALALYAASPPLMIKLFVAIHHGDLASQRSPFGRFYTVLYRPLHELDEACPWLHLGDLHAWEARVASLTG